MNREEYNQKKKSLRGLKPNNFWASFHILFFFALTSAGIFLSIQDSTLFYVLGQILLALSFLNGNILIHELGHGFFFKQRPLNDFFGHLISLSSIIPYTPWKLIHSQHHRWTGNKYKDPTLVDKEYDQVPERTKKVVDACWKYWIPLLGLSYSFGNFWNMKKLSRLFPSKKADCLFSIVLNISTYLALMAIVGPLNFLIYWGPAYYLFLAFSEPILLGQHVHMDQGDRIDSEFNAEKQYHVKDQSAFTRSVKFPDWFSRMILMGFDRHHTHHTFPDLPSYYYSQDRTNYQNVINWMDWFKLSKKQRGSILIFKTNTQTGIF